MRGYGHLDGGAGPQERLAIIGRPDLDRLSALVNAWNGRIDLLATDRSGNFTAARIGGMRRLRSRLLAQGMPPRRIRVVASEDRLSKADVVANLNGYGVLWNSAALPKLLVKCLHEDGKAVIEVRTGSGALPALRAKGAVDILSQVQNDPVAEKGVMTLLFRPNRALADWPKVAGALAGEHGFFRAKIEHSLLFIPRSDVLVVTFDNLDLALEKRRDQRPWGFDFIAKQGWSMLGVMASGWTWYRDDWLFDQFDQLAREGFFAGFRRVVFYGASMGGYGACTFARAVAGADVVAISPQTSLDKSLIPWETRYRKASARDFTDRYGDGAEGIRTAGQVYVFYDPYQDADARHADRLQGKQVMKLRAPLLGHRLGSSLGQMGVLSPLILAALEGRLTETEFYRALRCRHRFPRYQRELFQRALARGRPDLARRVAIWVLARGKHRFIRQAMEKLDGASGNLALSAALAGQ